MTTDREPSPPERGARGDVLLTMAALVVVIAALKSAQEIILPLVISAFLAALGAPLVRWMERKRVPKAAAVPAVLVLVLVVLAVIGLLIGNSVSEFAAAAPKYKVRINEMMASAIAWFDAHGINVSATRLKGQIDAGAVMSIFKDAFAAVASALSNTMLVLLTVVFMMFEAAGLPEKLRVAFGDVGQRLDELGQAAHKVQRYIWIKTVLSLATGLGVGLWLWILGVDFPVLWGVCAFLLNYIPNIGSLVAAVPAVLLSLVQLGWERTVLVVAGYFVVNFVIGNVWEPRMMGRELGLSALVVFLALVIWGWLWGPVGMLLSTPLTVIVQIMLASSEKYRWVSVMLGPSPDESAQGGDS